MVSHQIALFISDLAHCGLTAAGCSLSLLIKYLVVKYGARNCRCLCLILVHLVTQMLLTFILLDCGTNHKT